MRSPRASAYNNAVTVRGVFTNVASLTAAHTKSTHALQRARASDWRIRRVWCLTGNQQGVTYIWDNDFCEKRTASHHLPYKSGFEA